MGTFRKGIKPKEAIGFCIKKEHWGIGITCQCKASVVDPHIVYDLLGDHDGLPGLHIRQFPG